MAFLNPLPLLRAALTQGDESTHCPSTSSDEGVKYEVVEFDKVVFNHECSEDVFHDLHGSSSSHDDSMYHSIDTSGDMIDHPSPNSKTEDSTNLTQDQATKITLHVEIFTEDKFASHEASKNDNSDGKLSKSSQSLITETSAFETQRKSTICPVCLKRFANPFSRRRHEMIHTSSRPVQCQVCSRTFRNEDEFIIHSRIHMVRRSFSCLFCTKTFRRSDDLWKHYSLSHMDEIGVSEELEKRRLNYKLKKRPSRNPYIVDKSHSRLSVRSSCHICLKTFANSFSRRRHELIHSKPHSTRHPFRCKRCPQSFRWPKSLQKHYFQTHRDGERESQQKTYSCSYCDQMFNLFSMKLRHEQSQHLFRRLRGRRKMEDL